MCELNRLSINVFGLGYVGCVSAACLARDGHIVTGIDVSEIKLKNISEGKSPVNEPGIDKLISEMVAVGRLKVSSDINSAISSADVSLVCVGTPNNSNGDINLEYIERVCKQIGTALTKRGPGHVIVIRSTIMPGTLQGLVKRSLETGSGKNEGEHFFTAFNPEFLREGTAIYDYDHPPKIVIGTEHDEAASILKRIYGHLDAVFVVTLPKVAEMVKYVDNTWHALKVTFGNEIGEICHSVGIDSHAVISIFLQDYQLNISPTYLKPGFAFGGSCLPKDLRSLLYFARRNDIDVPMLNHMVISNSNQIEKTFMRVLFTGARKVGLYGLSFKPNTDDLRESPFVTLVEKLIGKGIAVRIFDENIQVDRLLGANKDYVEKQIPHFMELLVKGFEELEDFAEVVIIGHRTDKAAAWAKTKKDSVKVFDLSRLKNFNEINNYEGLFW